MATEPEAHSVSLMALRLMPTEIRMEERKKKLGFQKVG